MHKKDKVAISSLTFHIGYQLRLVSNTVSHTFAKNLAISDVTVAEWVILREMYSFDEATSPSVIAEKTGLTRGTVSKLIDRLLVKGLIARSDSLNDRRFQQIKLTLNAIKLVPKLASIADKNDEKFFSILTKSEKKKLVDILTKLAEFHKLKIVAIE